MVPPPLIGRSSGFQFDAATSIDELQWFHAVHYAQEVRQQSGAGGTCFVLLGLQISCHLAWVDVASAVPLDAFRGSLCSLRAVEGHQLLDATSG